MILFVRTVSGLQPKIQNMRLNTTTIQSPSGEKGKGGGQLNAGRGKSRGELATALETPVEQSEFLESSAMRDRM